MPHATDDKKVYLEQSSYSLGKRFTNVGIGNEK